MDDESERGVELLPCPFCGSDRPEMKRADTVWCGACLAEMSEHDEDVPNARQRWNTRATNSTAGWRSDMEAAPRDGTPIWVAFRSDIFPGLRPTRDDLKPWNGVQICVRHPGIFPGSDGKPFDPGWNVAAPVGQGGFPDDWIAAWMPLPPPPTTPTGERG